MKIFVTAKDTNDRISEKNFESINNEETSAVSINYNAEKQTLMGFGGAFTEAAAYTLSRMSKEKQKEVIDLYFSPEKGIGYTLGRMAISSCDFALGVYDYVQPGDTELTTFDMSHEEKWVIPMIKSAESVLGKPIVLLGSPWSPPAFMKDNNDKLHGGHLLEEYAGSWAKHFVKFIQGARNYGLTIEWISVQNEPAAVQRWDSCIYSGEQERDFVKNHLGPALEEAGLSDVKILVHDHNRNNLLPRVIPIFEDAEARKYVWGTGVHWYVSEKFEATSQLHEMHPDKHIIFTEGCQEGGLHLGQWKTGERYGRNIIGDLNNWVEGWIEWNLILDETGGPNHVNNLCDAPIVCNTKTDEIHINSSYYYIAHFSKFILPEAVSLESKSENEALKTLAARNPDGTYVLVVQNETDTAQSFSTEIEGNKVAYTLPPHSIATIIG